MAEKKQVSVNPKAELYNVQLKIKHYENVIIQCSPDTITWDFIFGELMKLKLEEQVLIDEAAR